MAKSKSLVIDVEQKSIPTGSLNTWSLLGNISVFIRDIQTPALTKETNIATLVSGIPSAFARVDLFALALDNASIGDSENTTAQNLARYYEDLVEEWKGFIACLALDYPKITVKKIDLEYSDGKDVGATINPYEPRGAFGNMLLERRKRWCDQNLNDNQKEVPYINIIKYDNTVVGATSPESLLFTSSGYSVKAGDDRPWVDTRKGHVGRFIDPLRSGLTEDQTAALFAYVNHMETNLEEMETYFKNLPDNLKPTYSSARSVLNRWKGQIENYARERGYALTKGSIPPVDADFYGPFAKLFKYKDELYGVEGHISETRQEEGMRAFDPKRLLLHSSAKIARLHLGPEYSRKIDLLRRLPMYVLKAEKKGKPGEYAFFALPLSAEGLNVYGKTIGALVGMGQPGTSVDSTLTAIYDPNAVDNNLTVTLTIRTGEGKNRTYSESYSVGNNDGIRNEDIILWPNFISKQWNQYYLYSELPHNSSKQTYSAFPFVGDISDEYFRILTDKDNNPVLLFEQGERINTEEDNVKDVEAELLVKSGTITNDLTYQYEIYKSNRPFRGVRLLSPTGAEGGYLLVNYTSAAGSDLPQNWMMMAKSLHPVDLGVDFGSTNTSVAYYSNATGEKGIKLKNRRVSMMGNELPGIRQIPRPNQLFFFQGREIPLESNAFKSILTLHHPYRLGELAQGQSSEDRMSKAVVGGFPCFVEDLPIKHVSEEKITLEYPGLGIVEQIHNMKWTEEALDIAHRQAYLQTLLLQIYAELFADNKVPTTLRWSYPSSMGSVLLNKYQRTWDSLSSLRPVLNSRGQIEPLDVSKVSDGLDMGATPQFEEGFGAATVNTEESFSNFGSNPFGNMGQSQTVQPQQETAAGGFGGFGGFGIFGAEPEQPKQSAVQGFSEFGNIGGGNAFGSKKKNTRPDLKPDDPDRVIRYQPVPLYSGQTNPSLTEATAVASFMSATYGESANQLTLCFDIGGSTTDISALFILAGESPRLTMIKQNSLRFAAQRVSRAVAYIPGFENVLNKICQQFKIQILGLNFGPRAYSSDTAQFYFDQIVDRLDEEQLKDLYQLIGAECPELMWVNMYVTGLLLYYAGQVAHKLIDDIAHTDKSELIPNPNKPAVLVTFAGKGSRLLQWLTTTKPQVAQQYYNSLFAQGFGGVQQMQKMLVGCRVELPLGNDSNIKFEVSKGLAKGNTTLYRPKDSNSSEIVGEAGYTIVELDNNVAELPPYNTITPEMIRVIGVYFNPPATENKCPKFVDFCGTFYNATRQVYGMSIPQSEFMKGFLGMEMVSYIQKLPEFREAKNEDEKKDGKFDFVAPIIILEGMRFYEEVLINALANKARR